MTDPKAARTIETRQAGMSWLSFLGKACDGDRQQWHTQYLFNTYWA